MRLIGWAIALAAAGLTPAAAQTTASAPAAGRTARRPQPAAARRQRARMRPSPPPPQPAIVYGTVGHAIPTPGIGEPDGRKGIQMQVRRSARKPSDFMTTGCCRSARSSASSSSACCSGRCIRYPPQRQPDPVAQLAQYADRGRLDARPGADPGRDRHPVDPALRHQYSPPAGRRHGQGDRPPMVLVLRTIPTMA